LAGADEPSAIDPWTNRAGYNPHMKIQPADRFEISGDVLSQEVNGETVLLNLDGESYFALNEVGTRIWQLLKLQTSVADTLDTLAEEYDVSREQLESDVHGLLDKLAGSGLIKLAQQG
jgi:hypothetical protein